MSAYVVERNHIRFLIEAAKYVARRERSGSFRWFHDGQWREMADESAVGQMLWDENRISVGHRYSEDGDLTPYFHEDSSATPQVPQILMSAHCYEYQSCEHPEWEQSSAHAFIESLIKSACRLVDGYEDAEWGAPDMGPAVVLLSKLVRPR